MENNQKVRNVINFRYSITEVFLKIVNVVYSYRSMQSRANGAWRRIQRHWGDAANALWIVFMIRPMNTTFRITKSNDKKYDMLKYVAHYVPYQTPKWCVTNISNIIADRFRNPSWGVSKQTHKIGTGWNWQIFSKKNVYKFCYHHHNRLFRFKILGSGGKKNRLNKSGQQKGRQENSKLGNSRLKIKE